MSLRQATEVGSADRPLRVAIVGSGPAGFYVASALRRQQDVAVDIDIFERLPTPYGLVRGGVAPDHQSIKAVTKVFERGADGFRFFGNVEVGRDVTVEELAAHYDQLVFAVGNEGDRRLGIPGEGLPRCTPAAVFVGWYNGHPDYRDAHFDLSARRVAVVGNGNVAIDVARILARDPDNLSRTDIASHALEALRQSAVEEIILLGRRGPVQAAFTPAELKELGELEGAVPQIAPEELELDAASEAALDAAPKQVRRNLEILRSYAELPAGDGQRVIRFRFRASPVELRPAADGGVGALLLAKNRLEANDAGDRIQARDSGEREELPVDLVLPAIGFAGRPLAGLPFDDEREVLRNLDGRLCDEEGALLPNRYVVGWARSGPRGLIGSHKRASAEVAGAMLRDLAAGSVEPRTLPDPDCLPARLASQLRLVRFADWQRLDAVERERGARRGAPRDKLTDVDEMLDVANAGRGARPADGHQRPSVEES